MKLIEKFTGTQLVELLAKMRWMEAGGYTADDIVKALSEIEALDKAEIKSHQEIELKLVLANPILKEHTPLCKKCGYVLFVIESKNPDYEGELLCACGESVPLDISPADYHMIRNAKIKGEELEFAPKDIMADKEDRLYRRKICRRCDFLKGIMCVKCGCSVKHRTYYDILTCPEEKW